MNQSIEVIISDIHHRITGVSATIRTLVPIMNSKINLVLVTPQPEPGVKNLGIWSLLKQIKSFKSPHKHLIWHVRRNNEMLWALIVKHVLGVNLKIVFTSAAIRRHSAYPRWLISKMDAIIATSEDAASFVLPVAATIPHGVDCERFKPGELTTANPDRYGLAGHKYLGIFGRVRPEKGTDLFVDAALEVLPKHPELKALIVGKTTNKFKVFKQSMVAKIDKAGLSDRFIWLDGVEFKDMPLVYQHIAVCVAPARYEGYGLVPLEAMACEVPVVASRTGAYEKMIIPGLNGDLVQTDNLPELIQSLNKVLSNPDELLAMGKAGRIRVKELFSAEVEADAIIEVYRSMWS